MVLTSFTNVGLTRRISTLWERRISTLSTLLPEKLQAADLLENLPHAFHKYYQKPIAQNPEVSLRMRHRGSNIAWTPSPLPNLCRGFLYCHAPQPASPLAASVRFRLTPGFDPASSVSPQAAFAAGSDLQVPDADGLPWSVPMWTLARTRRLNDYSDLLRADGVQVLDPPGKSAEDLTETSVALYALGQPFLVEFHMATLRVYLFMSQPVPPLRGRLELGFFDATSKEFRQPHRGMAIMTLERLEGQSASRLPVVDAGAVGLRVQKILSVSQEHPSSEIAPPVEGEIRPLKIAPVLFKEATKPTDPKYKGAQTHLSWVVKRMPHVSEMAVS
ncbi:hypothetical protein K438DRAFT_8244 [Mycena galopus ATCC 62051]|nr:hypothetical protein K438DRAFT_8244 [Mycena galopus ATCC 62051]